MTKFQKIAVLLVSGVLIASCSPAQAAVISEHDYNQNLLISYDFDEHEKEYITNKANGKQQKVNYVFNESNAEKIFKAPSDPLFKQGVHGKSLYMDGYSVRMDVPDFTTPYKQLTISCWIAPRGFENLVDYDGNSPARGHPRLSAIANQGNMEMNEGFTFGYGRLGKWGLQLCLHSNETDEDFMVGYYDPLHTLELYEWNHIAATYDGTTGHVALFYNGERAYEAYIPKLVDTEIVLSGEIMHVGYYCSPQIEFGCHRQLPSGLMDDFKLYEDSVPLKIIRDEYLAGCVNGEHPVLPFDEVKEDRSQYEGDRYRPIYHGIPSAVWMNEPHAPFYYKGRYHLFYQHNPIGPYWSQIRWAHMTSTDMVHWESCKDAVVPTAGICPEGVWTGGSVIGPDGTPWLIITAGTNQSTWTGQNIAFAHCKDPDDPYLNEWVVEDKVTITQPSGDVMGEREQFRDPFVWCDDGVYYMLVSTSIPGKGGSANVFTSTNMRDWTYHGYLYECPFDQYPIQGAHWECVVMFPISSKDGKIKKWILFDCPQYDYEPHPNVDCLYWIGNFNKETCKFEPDSHEPRLFDLGDGIYTGQTGFCYRTEEEIAAGKKYDEGRTVVIALAQGKSAGTAQNIDAGWAHNLAIPVEVHLDDDGTTVLREPIKEFSGVYDEVLYEQQEGTSYNVNEINSAIADIRGDALEINAKIHIGSESGYNAGLFVRYNKFTYNSKTEKTAITIHDGGVYVNRTESTFLDYPDIRDTNTYVTHDKDLDLRIYLDRSLLEIYINGKATITTRIYPKYGDSDYIRFFDNNAFISVAGVKITRCKSVYYDTTTPSYYGNTGNLEDKVNA